MPLKRERNRESLFFGFDSWNVGALVLSRALSFFQVLRRRFQFDRASGGMLA
jgi:hypothetical protein